MATRGISDNAYKASRSWDGASWLNITLRNWQVIPKTKRGWIRKSNRGKESHEAEEKVCRVSCCQEGRHFVSSPTTGSTTLSEMKMGYLVQRRPGMICCSFCCNAMD